MDLDAAYKAGYAAGYSGTCRTMNRLTAAAGKAWEQGHGDGLSDANQEHLEQEEAACRPTWEEMESWGH